MPVDPREQRDLVLAPNQYVLILDETKGTVTTHVGPNNIGIQSTQKPVVFDITNRRFVKCTMEEAIKEFAFVEEGSYVVLENPAVSDAKKHPAVGSREQTPDLDVGRKINIPGPATFPLWPGQVAKVVPGHILRSNEYLVVRVTNDEAARREWSKAVIKPKEATESEKIPQDGEKPAEPAKKLVSVIPTLTMGKLLVIKGTEVSFYIPPTGIEVVLDENVKYTRDAVTLEQIEYCILLNENGGKRYVQGPQVVFPEPTETFFEEDGKRKFRAYELNDQMGIYVKVIAPYKDDDDVEHLPGEELFITGKEQKIYYPRPEHAIIKYGRQTRHYAIAIPAGDSRYVLDKFTGEVRTVKGNKMLLPDPRKEVVVKRILDDKQVQLWYPGNAEALAFNQGLRQKPLSEEETELMGAMAKVGTEKGATAYRMAATSDAAFADEFNRKTSYTPPRALTLSAKFEGAVTVNVWTGYAVQVIPKQGERRVVIGPASIVLEYDETLEAVEFSTGTPKSDLRKIRTVFLRVLNNTVSDEIKAETKDLCQVKITVSYRVNFEGDPKKWFQVEDYVKLLTDHLRSKIRSSVRQHGIEEFYADSTAIVRDTVLGHSIEGKRTGQKFDENGMRVYDVEVLDVQMSDVSIQKMLVGAQQSRVQQALEIARKKVELDLVQQTEIIAQDVDIAKAETAKKKFEIVLATKKMDLEGKIADILAAGEVALKQIEEERQSQRVRQEISFATLETDSKIRKIRQETEDAIALEQDKTHNVIHSSELERTKRSHEEKTAYEQAVLAQKLEELKAETAAAVEKNKAITPDLIAALQTLGDKNLAASLAENLNIPAMIGGESVVDIAQKFFAGLGGLKNLFPKNTTLPKS